jgi:hypothetical protein
MSTSVVDSKVEDQTKKIKKPRVKKDTSTPVVETPVVETPVVEEPTKIKKSKAKKEEPAPTPKEEPTPASKEPTPASKEPTKDEEKPKAKRGRKPGVKKPVDENAVPAKKGRKPKVKSDDAAAPVDPIPKKERKPREALDVALDRVKSEGQTAIADANQKVADAQTVRENLFTEIEDLKSQEKEVLKIKNKAVRDLAKPESDSDDSKKKKSKPLDKDSLQASIDASVLKISQLKEQRALLSPKFTIAKRDEKKANALLLRVQTKNDKEIAKIQVRIDKKASKNQPTTTSNDPDQDNSDNHQDNHQDNHSDNDDDDDEDILTREIFIDQQLFLIDQHNKLYHPTTHLFIRHL